MLKAVKFIHSKGIIHRHISPCSVVYNDDKPSHLTRFLLTDFSFAAHARPPPLEHCGSLAYMAPEVYEKQQQTTAVDIWSLGVLALNVLLRLPLPHPRFHNFQGMKRFNWCLYMSQLAELCPMPHLDRMLKINVTARASASEILEALNSSPSIPARRLPVSDEFIDLYVKTQLVGVTEAAQRAFTAQHDKLHAEAGQSLPRSSTKESPQEGSALTVPISPLSSELQTNISRGRPSVRRGSAGDVSAGDVGNTEAQAMQGELLKGFLDHNLMSAADPLTPHMQRMIQVLARSVRVSPPTGSGENAEGSGSATAMPPMRRRTETSSDATTALPTVQLWTEGSSSATAIESRRTKTEASSDATTAFPTVKLQAEGSSSSIATVQPVSPQGTQGTSSAGPKKRKSGAYKKRQKKSPKRKTREVNRLTAQLSCDEL